MAIVVPNLISKNENNKKRVFRVPTNKKLNSLKIVVQKILKALKCKFFSNIKAFKTFETRKNMTTVHYMNITKRHRSLSCP